MSDALHDSLSRIAGPALVERDGQGVPRVVPDSPAMVAELCRTATAAGWRIRIEGRASWLPADAPADFSISTRGLDRVVSVSPADLVATVEAGATLDRLRRELAAKGLWLALDPPGHPERTIGSIFATGTAGALRQGFGPARDHVLGCTVVAGDGRVIEAGGRVVKNVAGYDLTRLQVGAFGAFGVITSLHLRLRALPATDVTLLARGDRDRLTHAARSLVAAAASLAGLELFSPALAADSEWILAARCLGPAEAAGPELANLMAMTEPGWERLAPDRAHAFWNQAARGALVAPVSLRMGALLDGVDDLLDLLHEHLGEGLVAAGAGTGSIRWSGDASAEQLRVVRQVAAEREIPLTLERAPYDLRQAVGHFGAYREGVGQLVTRLRETFDPKGILAVAVEGHDGR